MLLDIETASVAPPAERRQAIDLPPLEVQTRGWLHRPATPPLFIEVAERSFTGLDDCIAWAQRVRNTLDQLILEHGGIVLRRLPVRSADEFDRFISVFPSYQPGYVGGMSLRKVVKGRAMESTRYDERIKIPLHSEMAYTSSYPPRVAFFSRLTAREGGQTTTGSMDQMMDRFPVELLQKLEKHKARVVRNLAPAGATRDVASTNHPDKVGWDDVFYTQDRSEVEAHCQRMGMQFIWRDDGGLTLIDTMNPFTVHPKTGKRMYRSNLHTNKTIDRNGFAEEAERIRKSQAMPSGQYLDTGEMLTDEEAASIRAILEDIECAWQWRDGDLMILDNLQVMHGRNRYEGEREVLVALLDW